MLFKEVIGQENIKESLVQIAKSGRVSHAQLFHGNLGSGSFPMALAYAQYIFCQNKGELDSCGTCPSCLKIKTLTHPDLHFSFPVQILGNKKKSDDFLESWREMMLENPYSSEQDWYEKNDNENKKGVIGVDESIEIFKKLNRKSYEGSYKISIIWLAENMNASSGNKLLKLIEEPPDNTLIFLISQNLDQILPTILSRTQIIRLKTLSEEQIARELMNQRQVEELKAMEVASYVNGNYSEALREVSQQENASAFFELFVSWMRLCFKKEVKGAVTFSTQAQKLGKEKQKAFLLFVLTLFQKSLMGNFVGLDEIRIPSVHKDFIQKFMPYVHENNMEALHNEISEAYYHLDRNANAKILFSRPIFHSFQIDKKITQTFISKVIKSIIFDRYALLEKEVIRG